MSYPKGYRPQYYPDRGTRARMNIAAPFEDLAVLQIRRHIEAGEPDEAYQFGQTFDAFLFDLWRKDGIL